MKARILGSLFMRASSPRLTLVLLVYATFLVFGTTLMQSSMGIAEAQGRYVESFFFAASPFFWCDNFLSHVKIPLAGGALVGVLAVANLMTSCMRHARFGIQGFGVSITHMAIVLLILSGALQHFMRVEGRMSLRENSASNLLFLSTDSINPLKLPFTVRLEKFSDQKWDGSDIAKNYSSNVVFERDGKTLDAHISMNSPASFGGWTFFQMSYGDGGRTSILGAVRNPARLLPWLSVGATFFGMLVIFLPRLIFKRGAGNEK